MDLLFRKTDSEGDHMDNRSTIIDSLELRRSKSYYLIPLILLLFGVFICFARDRRDMIDLIHTHFTIVQYFFLLLLLSIVIYNLIMLTDNKVKVRIDKEGIWTKKQGTIPWTSIWYVYNTSRTERGFTAENIFIKLKESLENPDGVEIKIPLSSLDKTMPQVWETLTLFTRQYGIQDMGHDEL